MTTKDAVLKAIDQQQVRFIDLWFIDILGVVKSVTLPSGQLGHVIEQGVPFDGSSVDGFARVAESDMVLMPDVNTFAVLPWAVPLEERTARLICNVYTPQGEPFMGDSRMALIKVLQQAEEMGYTFKTGMEMEFFLFKSGEDGYAVISI